MKSTRTLGTLALFLVLGGGLIASQKLVSQNQDSRSSAAGGSVTPSGSCLVEKEPYTYKEYYAANGSTLCGPGGGWFHNDGLYKCVNGVKKYQSDCNADGNSGCLETRGAYVASDGKKLYYNYTGQCRNDKACTSLGGTCNVAIKDGPKVDSSCTTSGDKKGIVKANLCLSKDNFDTKRCCVPVSQVTYYYYDPLSKGCKSGSFTSLSDCKSAHYSACYSSQSSCNSSYSSCTKSNGSCILTSSSCKGTWKTGLCPGNTNIKCCVK
jgi:hypothetical protein